MRIGSATGWTVSRATVFPLGEQVLGVQAWHWSAYGPNGGTCGTAKTKAEARKNAQREAERLKQPRGAEE